MVCFEGGNLMGSYLVSASLVVRSGCIWCLSVYGAAQITGMQFFHFSRILPAEANTCESLSLFPGFGIDKIKSFCNFSRHYLEEGNFSYVRFHGGFENKQAGVSR
jgi:hypothetical protein